MQRNKNEGLKFFLVVWGPSNWEQNVNIRSKNR